MILGFIIFAVFCFLINTIGVRKSYCVYFVYSILDTGIPFLPQVPVSWALLLVFFSLFLVNKRKYKSVKYPFAIITIFYLISVLLSAKFSSVSPHWGMLVKGTMKAMLVPYLTFYFIDNQRDLRFLSKCLFAVTGFVFLNLIVELITGEAYIQNYIGNLNGNEDVAMRNVYRYGVKRCQSVFIHSTSLGYFCAMFFCFISLCFSKENTLEAGISKNKYYLLLGCLLAGVLLSGTRSSIIPLAMVCVILYLKYSKKKFFNAAFVGVVVAITICICAYDFLYQILSSIVDSSSNKVGSSSEMRFEQFEIAAYYWLAHPILGWGPGATFDVLVAKDWRLLGAESVWMPLLMDSGIVGCVAYISWYVAIIKLNQKNRAGCILLMLAFLLNNTMTSVPGFGVGFLISMGILFFKYNRIFEK